LIQSQQVAGQVGQGRTLTLGQVDVRVDALALHAIDEIADTSGNYLLGSITVP
jgi:hypothetical protein